MTAALSAAAVCASPSLRAAGMAPHPPMKPPRSLPPRAPPRRCPTVVGTAVPAARTVPVGLTLPAVLTAPVAPAAARPALAVPPDPADPAVVRSDADRSATAALSAPAALGRRGARLALRACGAESRGRPRAGACGRAPPLRRYPTDARPRPPPPASARTS